MAGLTLLGDGCHRQLPVIDLEAARGGPTPSTVRTDSRLPLRCAVAAMLSPAVNRDLYSDLLHRVASQVGRRALIAQRRTYAEVDRLIEEHRVDLAFICSGPYVEGQRKGTLELLAVPVVGGKTTYRSYVIVRRASPFRSLDDLRGHTFVFTDPESNTGHLVLVAMLARRHMTPQRFFSSFWYSHAHDTSIRAVAEGLADGAAVDSLIFDYVERSNPSLIRRVRIIARSEPFGIPPVVVPTGLDPEFVRHLRHVFLSLHRDPGTAVLLRRLGIDRFVAGTDAMYDSVRALTSSVPASEERGP